MQMVKSLLEGQKVLEKELTELKTKQTKEEANKSKLIEQQYSQFEPPLSFAPSEKPASRAEKEPSGCRKRTSTNTMNHSLLVAESSKGGSREKRNPKKQPCRKKDFEELYQ